MKKLYTLLFAVLASSTISNAAIVNGTCGDNLTWSLNTDDSTLVISGTGAMYNYDWNSPWSGYSEDIKYVTIGEGVTTIGSTAFRDHIHMQQCSLPSTLTSIGNEAFCFCFQLINVEIPASCTYIDGSGAFNLVPNVVTQNESLLQDCGARSINGYVEGYFVYADSSKKSLRACSSAASGEIILDDAIWRIEYMAFAECRDITYIHFGRHLKSIGEWALNGCIGLEGFQFGEELEEIGSAAFGNCFGLKYVYFPNSLVSVGDFAIGNCPVLRTIHLGNSLSSIGSQFFDYCPSIDTIYATMPTPPVLDNTDFAETNLTNVKCYVPYESLSLYQKAPIWKEMELRAIEEPEKCLIISGNFGDNLSWELSCDSVLTISGTSEMMDFASPATPWSNFKSYVKYIEIEDGVTSIGKYSFSGCNVVSVNLPNSIVRIGEWAFFQCGKLTSVVFGSGLTTIEDRAFAMCYELNSVTIPSNVASIGTAVFSNCSSIKSLTVDGGNSYYDSQNNCNAIIETATNTIISGCENTIIPVSVTHIGAWSFTEAFGYGAETTTLNIPGSITNIGDGAFYQGNNLTSMTCEALTPPSLGSDVFYGIDKSIPLYVPVESVELYQNANQWKDFTNILPIVDPTADITINYIDKDSELVDSEKVTLNLPEPPIFTGFTFQKWVVVASDLEDGITIQAVYTANTPTSAPEMYTNPANPAQKLIREGNVYILKGENTYTLTGQKVK